MDPLPRSFLTEDEGIGGRIKVRPEDFLVDEQPLYQPCGNGEHLYLCIEKKNVSHAEMLSTLRKHFGVRDRAIGFAGMKDKVGVTRQIVSIHLPKGQSRVRDHGSAKRGQSIGALSDAPMRRPGSAPSIELPHRRIAVLWADRHTNKIKRGHLAGNRFSIRIRDVDPLKAPLVMQTLRALERHGVPNFFGAQRFGYRRNNHLLGAMLLAGEYDNLLAELLGTTGTPYPEYQQERRELYEAERYEEALAMWTPADGSERSALRALMAGRDAKGACFAVGKTTWNFWVASFQSAIFNRVVDQRLGSGQLDSLVEGDLAWKHDSRSVFAVTAELAGDPEIAARLSRLEISPSGPLWGTGMTQASGEVGRVELRALAAMGVSTDQFHASPHAPEGSRRSLRERLSNPEIESGIDEHGPFIRVAFDLPRGAYATVALREIMKNEQDEGE